MIVLHAKENMWLTQSEDISNNDRVYTDVVYLAVNDSESRWRDATNEEKDEWESRINEESEVEDVQ